MKTKISSTSQVSENTVYFILIALYTVQGIILSFFMSTLSILLVEKGASFSDIAILHLSSLPYSFKLFFAPFLDIFYSEKLGKRKTYIISANYLLSFILLVGSVYIERMIEMKQIYYLMYFGIFCIFLLALQDIAADGLGSDVFKGNDSIYASVSQTIGISVGMILSSNVLVQLNSKKFCEKYFNIISDNGEGILKISYFLGFIAVFLLFLTIYIHKCLIEEKREENTKREYSLKEPVFALKKFFSNRNLLAILVFLFANKLVFSFLDASFKLKLIQKGFPKEDFAHITSFLSILGVFFQISLPKFLKKIHEINLFYVLLPFKFLENFLALILLELFEKEQYDSWLFWMLLIIVCTFDHLHRNVTYGVMGSVFVKISQTFFIGFEETSLAFLTSVGNVGKRSTDFVSLSLIDYFDLKKLVFFGWGLGGAILLILKEKLFNLERIIIKEKDADQKAKQL